MRDGSTGPRPVSASGSVRRAVSTILLTALLATTVVVVDANVAAATGTITGTVFRDYNSNGQMDTSGGIGVAVDTGVAGVTVRGYDSTGALVGTTTTGSNGTYSLGVTGEASSDIRVEFSGFPSGLQPSATGTGSTGVQGGTTVQFVQRNATGVNLGIQAPEEYSQSDPPLVTPIQRAGAYNDSSISGYPAVTSLPWTAGYSDVNGQTAGTFPSRKTLATTGQVGPIWGTAFQASTNSLYAAATLKRQSGLGPLGLGGIYRISGVLGSDGNITAGTPTVSSWLDVQGKSVVEGGTVDVGTVSSTAARGITSATSPALDLEGFQKAGKVGIGGIAISADQNTLYFVNLYDKNLYSIDISDPAAAATSPVIHRYSLGLGSGERPWAITVYRNEVYVGYVDTGESLATPTSASAAGLKAHVIKASESDLTSWSGELLGTSGMDLGFTKGPAVTQGSPSTTTNLLRWNTWTDEWSWSTWGTTQRVNLTWYSKPAQIYPQPILSDLQFDDGGYLTLGFADRTSIQGGNRNYSTHNPAQTNDPPFSSTFYEPVASGDIIIAAPHSPADGTFDVESDGSVGTRTGYGVGDGDGPGGGEFYHDSNALGTGDYHDETTLGSLGLLYGVDEIVSTSYDPLAQVRIAGQSWYSPTTGDIERGYNETLDGSGNPQRSPDGTFQKGGGLGDLETLSELAPTEIGNRVWFDANHNGLQDAGEAGIDGVTVLLRDSSDAVVGTAVTANGGEYYFSSAITEAAAGDGDNRGGGLTSNGAYTIQVGVAADYGSGGPLEGMKLTMQDATTGGDAYAGQSDALDSDAAPDVGTLGTDWFPLITVASSQTAPGDDNHTFDAGFVTPYLRDLALIKSVTSATGPTADGTVTFNIRVINQGPGNVDGVTISDYIDGDQFAPLAAAQDVADTTAVGSGNAIAVGSWGASTGTDPAYTSQLSFSGVLEQDDYVDIPITLSIDIAPSELADAIANGLKNYAEISVFDTDGNPANGDSSTGDVIDVDSVPDANPSNDVLKDDVVDEAAWTNDGVTMVGPSATADEDDHDVATLPLYDLALIKTRSAGQDAYITAPPPQNVSFDITVKNQGGTAAYLVHVKDSVGTGLAIGTNSTAVVTSSASNSRTITYAGSGEFVIDQLDPGESVTFPVITIADPATQSTLVNTAEITQFDNDSNAGNGIAPWVADFDSTPDANPANDALEQSGVVFPIDSHNNIDNAPVNGINIADEDDHDSEGVSFALMRIGSTVYIDANGNLVGDGTGEGVAGVRVDLRDAGGTVIAQTYTDANGDYFFAGLYPGDYTVGIPTDQTGAPNPTALDGYETVPGAVTNPEALNFDNDGAPTTGWLALSDTITLTYGSEPADQVDDGTRADAAVGAYPDGASNLNIDFVFQAKTYELGDLVWFDANNNGVADSGEAGVPGVTVDLYRDNGNGTFEPGTLDGGPIASTVTASDGTYRFADLPRGDYFVHIAAQSALNGVDTSGTPSATPNDNADNDNNAVVDATNGGWTSGLVSLGEGTGDDEPTGETDGTTGDDAEASAAVADNRSNQTVDFGFVQTVRIGNQVWRDESDSNPATEDAGDNNGTFDAGSGEVGIAGVTVELWKDDGDGVFEPGSGDTLVDSTTTDTEGNYWFEGVTPGLPYFVAIQDVPSGFTTARASGVVSTNPTAADNVNDGAPAAGYVSVSQAFTATLGGAPTGEHDAVPYEDAEAEANAAGTTYDDNDSNLQIDFGFVDVPLYRVGNLVWKEPAPDGTADATDPGLGGVLVQLLDNTDTVIAETATDANGYYAFENLVAGDYRVRIPGNQTETLGGGLTLTPGVLDGLAATVLTGNADPDINPTDNDSNGVLIGGNWQSPQVTLGGAFDAAFGTEPTNEVFRGGGDDDTGWTNGPDDRSNFTVDFGFYPQMRIGDTVWLDDGGSPYASANEDNGVYDANESPIAGVDVNLYADDGDGVFEPGTDDAFVYTTTTDSDGQYFFLAKDGVHYWVAIPSTQTTNPTVLDNLRSSTGQASDDSVNSHDQGAPETGFASVSNLVTMSLGSMSNGDSADEANADTKTGVTIADANSDLAIDFGFSPTPTYAIGNLVWKDVNNNGVADAGEEGLPGVTVDLYLDNGDSTFTSADGPAVATTTTGPDGRYLFEGLDAGTYFAVVPTQTAIQDYFPSGTPNAAANDDTDNDNNGVPDDADHAVADYVSGPVVLGNGNDHAEPTGETDGTTGDDAETPVTTRDDRSNQTVDFGFWTGMRLGNLVWHDESDSTLSTTAATDDNGVADAGETPMPGVTVLLYRDGGDGVFDAGTGGGDDTYLGNQVTDSDGNYWFEHLAPGDYFVAVATLPGGYGSMVSSTGQNPGGAGLDNNDNGVAALGGDGSAFLSVSDRVTLADSSAPTGEADAVPSADGSAEAEANAALDTYADDNSDLTVDLGFVQTPLYRVGNLVWEDLNRDGVADAGEPGVPGVLVQLLDGTNTVVAETVTDSQGKYAFEDLAAGDYRVRIPGSQTQVLGGGLAIDATALDNLISTTDGGTAGVDNDDNGAVSGADWVSSTITLGSTTGPYETEPTTETLRSDDATDDDTGWASGTDARSNFTVDFGFYPGLRLGDTVWLDDGGSPFVAANEDNGVYDAGESPIPGVDVRLYADDGDGVFEPGTDDALVDTTETDSAGEYFFTGLDENVHYWVAIPDAATQDGTELDTLRSSAGQAADGAGTNDLDHGAPVTGFAAVSPLVVLARGSMTYGDSADESNADTKTGFTLADGDSNLVEDFGFSPVPTYEIGDLVWLDNDNGTADSGETGIPNITVQLFKDNGDGTFEPGGGESDGLPVASTTTDADGVYHFTGLAAGTYWVFVPEQSGLDGLASSQVRQTNAGNDVDNDNNAIEFTYTITDGWASSLITVGEGNDHQEPTGETDGTTGASAEDGTPRDDRANQTVDFGFSPRIRVGNQVWRDESDANPATSAATDNNGVFDAGSGEVGIGGVGVELWFDTNGDGFQGASSDDVLVDSTTTDSEGNYVFADVVPDANYYVAIPTVGSPFTTARSSAGQSADASAADNDDDGAPSSGYLAVSRALDLVLGSEPTGEADAVPAEDAEAEANAATGTYPDANSNLRVDFGFIEVPLYRIGNRVWLDSNNDGVADAGEPGIAGVWVQLQNAAGSVIGETVTDSTGYYAFENLAAGDYRVVIPTDQSLYSGSDVNFDANALDNLASSTTDDANANGDVDNDDNGVVAASDWRSGLVTLGAGADAAIGTEPTSETYRSGSATDDDTGWVGGPDDRSNFTVDFGFYELLRLGNWVWLDDGGSSYVQANEDNGVFDSASGEAGIAGVDLNLYADDGDGVFEPGGDDALVDTTTTDAHGHYYFTGLTEGHYWVAIPDSQPELTGLRSSTGQAADDLTDSRDQGAPQGAFSAVSHVVVMDSGAMVTGEGAWETVADGETGFSVADASSQLTIDFGFSPIPEYALGNLVWEDYNNDGVADSGEPGIPGLTVELYRDNGDGVLTAADGAAIATDTTDAAGRYLFEGLAAGSYLVHIPDQAGLTGWTTSGTPVANADGDADNDNNGVADASNGGWTAGAVSLGEGDDNSEPTGETDGTSGASAETPVSVRDDRSNQTVDFGFWRGLRLGNQVWLDEGAGAHENNGVYDADETPIAGVTVQIWRDGGDATFDAGSGDDVLAATTTTNGSGHYYAGHLAEGSYWVAVPSIPGGGVLSSTNTTGPSLALDGEDDGAPSGGYLSVSPLYTLSIGGAPTGETDGPGVTSDDAEAAANSAIGSYRDADSYLGVDFGFINVPVYRIGNLVWFDYNDDGVADAGEPGIPGVLVQLYDATDTLIDETVTGADGTYAFDNLAGGDYRVAIPTVQDAVDNSLDASIDTTALSGFFASTTVDATANDDADNDSNGTLSGAAWSSSLVTLGGANPDAEPTDEQVRADDATDDDAGQASPRIDDDRSNFSVDFGFSSLSLGNMVFEDLNNNGVYEPALGDSGIDGVTVELWKGGSLVQWQTTSGGGLYLFTGLEEGATYTVVIPAANFASSAPLSGYWSSTGDAGDADILDTDGLDRGIDLAAGTYGAISSYPVTVNAGGEPTTDGQSPNPDNDTVRPTANENLVLDFGFVRLELGGNVFHDFGNATTALNNNGLDDGDGYFAGVTLLLYNGDGTPFLREDGAQATTTTDASGNYVFTGLPEGDFIVEIPASNFVGTQPLKNTGSSDGNDVTPGVAPNPNNDVSGEDNGNPVSGNLFDGGAVRSGVVTLAADTEPTGDTAPSPGTPDANSNRTVDFGFWIVQDRLELGNQLWFDTNKNGVYDRGVESPVPAGVRVELWDATTNTLYAVTYTDGLGHYLFSGLPEGEYFLVLPASNFDAGGPLFGYHATSGSGVSMNPDNGTDDDSNGADANGGVRSADLSLVASMPTLEPEGYYTVSDDRLSDLTLDIGLVERVLAATGFDPATPLRLMAWFLMLGFALLLASWRVRRSNR